MSLRPDIIEKLRTTYVKKFIHFAANTTKLYEDVVQIEFNNLYVNILIGLFENGLIDKKWKEDIERAKWFLKNRGDLKLVSPDEYKKWKIFCNLLYSRIQSQDVVIYLSMFYTELIEKYPDRIIYIDTDLLILNFTKSEFQTGDHIPELNDFKYDITFINYFYAENIKRYIKQYEFGEFSCQGIKDPKKSELEGIIKREIREKKLNILDVNF